MDLQHRQPGATWSFLPRRRGATGPTKPTRRTVDSCRRPLSPTLLRTLPARRPAYESTGWVCARSIPVQGSKGLTSPDLGVDGTHTTSNSLSLSHAAPSNAATVKAGRRRCGRRGTSRRALSDDPMPSRGMCPGGHRLLVGTGGTAFDRCPCLLASSLPRSAARSERLRRPPGPGSQAARLPGRRAPGGGGAAPARHGRRRRTPLRSDRRPR